MGPLSRPPDSISLLCVYRFRIAQMRLELSQSMVSRAAFAPLVSKLDQPVSVADDLCYVLPTSVAAEEAKRLLLLEAQVGVARPGDIRDGFFEEPVLVHLPIWRTSVHAEGFHIGVSTISIMTGRDRRIPLPIPTGGVETKDVVVLTAARRFFPFDPTPALVIPQQKMIARAHSSLAGVVAEMDVPQAQAEQESIQRVRTAMRPSNALYAKMEANVRSIALVYVPLWVMRYRYDGEAVPNVGQEFHVLLDGAFGRVLSASHPSAFRSILGKAKSLFATR